MLVPHRPLGRCRVVCRIRKGRNCCILGGSTLPVCLDPFLFNHRICSTPFQHTLTNMASRLTHSNGAHPPPKSVGPSSALA
jgi:hypothetical protein